jgi:uncharacterized protein
MKTKIVIAGGAGFLGRLLINYFIDEGCEVTIITRKQVKIEGASTVLWDGQNLGNWAHELEDATALINLAGRSVDCRYTKANKKEIMQSRVLSTRALGKAVQLCKNAPQVWLNSSSATLYRHAETEPMDEDTGEIGTGFSVEVCLQWEREFFSTNTPNTRKVALRMAMVMGNEGGAWPVLTNLCRFGLGGRMGTGAQYFSWIHTHDFCRSIDFLINTPLEGPVNISAPHPVQNAVFMRELRKHLGISIGIPHPKWSLEVGAMLLRTEAELMLKSSRVVPTLLQQNGFVFAYPEIEGAMQNLVQPKPNVVFF